MAAPTLYKKKPAQEVHSRPTYELSQEELTRVNTVVARFFEKFKTVYLS